MSIPYVRFNTKLEMTRLVSFDYTCLSSNSFFYTKRAGCINGLPIFTMTYTAHSLFHLLHLSFKLTLHGTNDYTFPLQPLSWKVLSLCNIHYASSSPVCTYQHLTSFACHTLCNGAYTVAQIVHFYIVFSTSVYNLFFSFHIDTLCLGHLHLHFFQRLSTAITLTLFSFLPRALFQSFTSDPVPISHLSHKPTKCLFLVILPIPLA